MKMKLFVAACCVALAHGALAQSPYGGTTPQLDLPNTWTDTTATTNANNGSQIFKGGTATAGSANVGVTVAAPNLNGSGSIAGGTVKGKTLTQTKTANYALATADSGIHFDNAGASGEVDFALPASVAGLSYCFLTYTAQTLKIIANGTDVINVGLTSSSAGGNYSTATRWSNLCLETHGGGQWNTVSVVNTWIGA